MYGKFIRNLKGKDQSIYIFFSFPFGLIFRFNKNASSIMEIMDGFAAKIN